MRSMAGSRPACALPRRVGRWRAKTRPRTAGALFVARSGAVGETGAMGDEAEELIGCFVGDLDTLLAAIDRAEFQEAVLVLDGDPSHEVTEFVLERSKWDSALSEANRQAAGKRKLGVTFGTRPLQLPIEGTNVRDLLALSQHHAEPEIAICIEVTRGAKTLVSAPDIGDNEIWVNANLGEQQRTAFIKALGPE